MRAVSLILILFLMVVAGPVAAQKGPENALFDQISSLRLGIERLNDARVEVTRQRDRLTKELEHLAALIERQKSAHPSAELLPNLSLQQMLRQSQELSGKITLIDRELSALERVRRDRLELLAQQYDHLVRQIADSARTADGERQAHLLQLLARARGDRELIRKDLDRVTNTGGTVETKELLASEDPEELIERADVVRDEQDRLRRQLAQLEKRVSDLRADARLDQEVRDFVDDVGLFGEESRTLRLSQPSSALPAASKPEGESYAGKTGESEPVSDADVAPGETGFGHGANRQDDGESASPDFGAFGSAAEEGTAPMLVDQGSQSPRDLDPVSELRRLAEQRRQHIERIKNLQILHDRLREKAESLSNQ